MTILDSLKGFKRKMASIMRQRQLKNSQKLFLSSDIYAENLDLIKSLKGIHIGRRAFIICNGPSLTPIDLTKIHQNGDISIASNKIDKIFPQTKWRPTYYAVFDANYVHSLVDTMNNMPARKIFLPMDSYKSTRHVKSGNAVWLNTWSKESARDIVFSEDLTSFINPCATVTYAMIQILVYMGIHDIYIIGCDNSYAKTINKDGSITENKHASYFSGCDNTKKNVTQAVAIHKLNEAYEYARQYANTHDVRIFNATRGGYLETFERVDFDNLFPKKA